MKLSEKYKIMSMSEENDWKAWTYHFKSEREKRNENFLEIYEELKLTHKIRLRKNGAYLCELEDMGLCDFYPKANKILFRRKNHWMISGLEYILNNLVKLPKR